MRQIDCLAGSEITSTIKDAILTAGEFGEPVEFEFNDVTVQVAADPNPELIYRDLQRGLLRPSGTFTVEPYPPAELTREQIAQDANLYEEIEQRRRDSQREYEKRQKAAAATVGNMLAEAPPIALKDEDGWRQAVEVNSGDGYSAGVIQFAESWARLMQLKLSQGVPIADCADECCPVADGPIGITGFMYGCAVGILAQVWEHGEELRRWHNLKTQNRGEGEIANEIGGVLNPALLVLG